jgi:hypothetical protein
MKFIEILLIAGAVGSALAILGNVYLSLLYIRQFKRHRAFIRRDVELTLRLVNAARTGDIPAMEQAHYQSVKNAEAYYGELSTSHNSGDRKTDNGDSK